MSKSPTHVALVTGANRGIGFEVCRQLAAAGAVEPLLLDVTAGRTIKMAANQVATRYGYLDVQLQVIAHDGGPHAARNWSGLALQGVGMKSCLEWWGELRNEAASRFYGDGQGKGMVQTAPFPCTPSPKTKPGHLHKSLDTPRKKNSIESNLQHRQLTRYRLLWKTLPSGNRIAVSTPCAMVSMP
jgi:hypothetical protein